MCKAAVLRQLLGAARVNHTNIRCDDNVRRTWVAKWRNTRFAIVLLKNRPGEDLPDASLARIGLKDLARIPGLRRIVQPQQRNVVLGRADSSWIVWRLRDR